MVNQMIISYEYVLTFIDLLTILRNFTGDSIRKLGIYIYIYNG